MANTQIGKLGQGIIGLDSSLGNLFSGGASSLGLSRLSDILKKKTQKRADLYTRYLNDTGTDDPFLLNLLKDMSRPARQGAVGLGIGAAKLGGGDVSQYLQGGQQGIGDFSFLLDPEERQALSAQPSKEIAKSLANVAGLYATGGLSAAYGPAAAGIKSLLPRILAKGAINLPGNLMQAYGQTEEYKGESPAGAMTGAGISSFLFPALGEGIKALGTTKLDKLRNKAFKSAEVGDEAIKKLDDYYTRMGTQKDQALKDIELLQRGKSIKSLNASAKNDVKKYLLALKDSGIDEGQVNMSLKALGVKPTEISTSGISESKLRSYGLSGKEYEKLGSDKAKQGVAVVESEAKRLGLGLNDRFAKENAVDIVANELDSKISEAMVSHPTVQKQGIVDNITASVKDIKNYDKNPAYIEVMNTLNNYGDELSGKELRNIFTIIQDAGKLESKSPSASSSTTRIFNKARDAVRQNVVGKANMLMGKLGSVLDVKNAVTKKAGSDIGPTIFGIKTGFPGLTKAVEGTMSTVGNVASGIGNGINSVAGGIDSLAGMIPPGVAGMGAGQIGRMIGSQPETQGIQGTQDAKLGRMEQGISGAQQIGDGGWVDVTVPGFGPGTQNDPFGLMQQQPMIDTQKLQVDLINAVMSGKLSPTDAEYVLGAMQKMSGGGGDITTQIGSIAQNNPEQARQLLGQAVLGGEIGSATAKTYADLMGFDADTPENAMVSTIDNAINLVDKYGGSVAGKIPTITGKVSEFFGGASEGTAYRSMISEIRTQLIKEIAGTAQTPAEMKNLRDKLPQPSDEPEVAKVKLNLLKSILSNKPKDTSVSNDYESWLE